MNAATRKLIDEKFTQLRLAAEVALADAEINAEKNKWSSKAEDANNAFLAAKSIADALVIANGIALGVTTSPGVVVR